MGGSEGEGASAPSPSSDKAAVDKLRDAFPGTTVLAIYPRRHCNRCGELFTAFVDRWRECTDCRLHPIPLWKLRQQLETRGEM
jgi:hypothetical protein